MGFLIRLLIALLIAFLIAVYFHRKASHQTSLFDEWIWEAAEKYQVDPLLIKAVIWQETQFDPTQYGKAQERGLMQITPVVGYEWAAKEKKKRFKPNDLFDPRTNIMVGTWYLQLAFRRWKEWDDPLPFALAEYNAGRSNALRWASKTDGSRMPAEEFIQRIGFPTTKNYVVSILAKYADYTSAAGGPSRLIQSTTTNDQIPEPLENSIP